MGVADNAGILDNLLVDLSSNGFVLTFLDTDGTLDLLKFGTAGDVELGFDGSNFQIETDVVTAGAELIVRGTQDGAEYSLNINNAAGTGSSDESVALRFQHAGYVGGGIVSQRLDTYAVGGTRDSRIDVQPTLDEGDAAGISVLPKALGIGTTTIPHAGVGVATFAHDGTNASSAGPTWQVTTTADNWPLVQYLHFGHDNVGVLWDAFWDGSGTKSSDPGSCMRLHKVGDAFYLSFDTGITAGEAVTWDNFFIADLTTGSVSFGTHDAGFAVNAAVFNATTTPVLLNAGNHPRVILTANITGNLRFTAPANDSAGTLLIIQDATGSRTIAGYDATGSTAIVWLGGAAAPTLTTTANAVDVVGWRYDSTLDKLFLSFNAA